MTYEEQFINFTPRLPLVIIIARGERDTRSKMIYPYPEVIRVEADFKSEKEAREYVRDHYPSYQIIDWI